MTPLFAVDSNCMVAAISDWHGRREAVTREIDRRLDGGERMSLSVHAITEAYSVLTRMPPPQRFTPEFAWVLLEKNFVAHASLVALNEREHLAWLREQAMRGTAGGRVYDSLIGECAKKARATALLTLNARHFDPPPDGVAIVEPTP